MVALNLLYEALHPKGLNVGGVAAPEAYDRAVGPSRQSTVLFPATRAIVVIGSGGPDLWHAFLAWLRADPGRLTGQIHPLDAFVRQSIAAADPVLGDTPRRWFFASADAEIALDFRVLAHAAGLGSRSRLGLLMHPVHGPWMGLRAACFLGADLPPSTPGGPDPCADCPAPCIAACPGQAFPLGLWDANRCADFHTESSRCLSNCEARLACPQGMASRYPSDEIFYHYNRAAGRGMLRALLGIHDSADPHEGIGPMWSGWRQRANVKG